MRRAYFLEILHRCIKEECVGEGFYAEPEQILSLVCSFNEKDVDREGTALGNGDYYTEEGIFELMIVPAVLAACGANGNPLSEQLRPQTSATLSLEGLDADQLPERTRSLFSEATKMAEEWSDPALTPLHFFLAGLESPVLPLRSLLEKQGVDPELVAKVARLRGRDWSLVRKAQQGDTTSCDLLLADCQDRLVGFFLARIMGGSREDAEDCVQEVLVQALETINTRPTDGGYDPCRGSYYTYLCNRFGRWKLREFNRKKIRDWTPIDLNGQKRLEESHESPSPLNLMLLAEREKLKAEGMTRLLRITFLCGGYPHQQLAFAFSKLIYGKPSNRTIEGSPSEVHEVHGNESLGSLADEFLTRYCTASGQKGRHFSDRVEVAVNPIYPRMAVTVGKLMSLDSASLKQQSVIIERRVKETCLQDYYERRKGGFKSAIPDWCYKLEERVRKILGLSCLSTAMDDEGEQDPIEAICPEMRKATNSCKLRHLPPCNAIDKSSGGARTGEKSPIVENDRIKEVAFVSHLTDASLLRYVSGKTSEMEHARVDLHVAQCEKCLAALRAALHLRENFDDIWEAWNSEEHGRSEQKYHLLAALSSMEEKQLESDINARSILEKIDKGVQLSFVLLLDRARQMAVSAARGLPEGLNWNIVPAVTHAAVAGSDEDRKLKNVCQLLADGRDDEAAEQFVLLDQVNSLSARTSTVDVVEATQTKLVIDTDSRSGRISVRVWRDTSSRTEETTVAILIPHSDKEKARMELLRPVEAADYLLAEFKDVPSGGFELICQ